MFVGFILVAITLIFTACSGQYDVGGFVVVEESNYAHDNIAYAQATVVVDEPTEQVYIDTTHNTDFVDDLFIHWDNGITQFGSRIEGNINTLYRIENYGSHITQLTTFPSLNVEWGQAETEWCSPQLIFQLDVVGDWVILSVGQIQGSMGNFFGDLHRVRLDGSGREAFHLGTNEHRFIVIDDWIYNHIWCHQGCCKEGWIRIRPDGTDREFLGDFIYTIILFGDDGYIYGTNTISGEGNLARWRPESDESIMLFLETDAPTFDEFFSRVSYQDIVITDEYVYFTVFVFGAWDYAQPLGRRTPWEGLHTANFRVDKDGNNLILLNERYHLTVRVFDLFRSVLRSEKQFRFVSGFGSFYLDEYLSGDMPQAHEMAVFDLFGNGQEVVVLNLGYTLKLVLFYYDNEIWAEEVGIRSMSGITQYGTFSRSGGGGSFSVARAERMGSEINYVTIFGRDWLWQGERVDGHIYFLYDSLISCEEYSALLENQLSKEGLNWHPFTEASIWNLTALKTVRL
ncbi:MAG: hypothetical protein FWE30_08280 [Bacteroidales bacterium]|nr:hypothetical protein [Bacteroidales bacterium]